MSNFRLSKRYQQEMLTNLRRGVLQFMYDLCTTYYNYVRLQIKQRKDPSFKVIAAVVVQRLQILWKKAFIPHLSRKRITSILQQDRHKMNNLLKSKSKNSDNYKRKVQLLRDSAHKNLFHVSACKCLEFERCTCKLKNRVPLAERDFLCD